MLRDDFSTVDAGKVFDVTREGVKDWIKNGFAMPTVPAEGKGTRASFTRNDLYLIGLFKRLTEYGFKRENAGKFTREIAELQKAAPAIESTTHVKIFENKDGENYVELVSTADWADFYIDMKAGHTFWRPKDEKNIERMGKSGMDDYSLLLIVNFAEIKENVDYKLKKL